MENASKALLIAGAILIAILLIAIGMMVFNSANGVIDTAASGMSDNEKEMHNKKFTVYAGMRSGSTVKSLLDVIEENNSNSQNHKFERIRFYDKDKTMMTGGGSDITSAYLDTIENSLSNTATYEIVFGDQVSSVNGTQDGLVSSVNIYAK